MAEFQRRQIEYADIERAIGDIFQKSLEKEKAIFHWESRVKNPESLRTKLYKREEVNTYPDQRENCASLKGLVAGRIVLPRWAHFNTVKEIMRSNFEIQSETQHPKMPKEPKYLGETHYLLRYKSCRPLVSNYSLYCLVQPLAYFVSCMRRTYANPL